MGLYDPTLITWQKPKDMFSKGSKLILVWRKKLQIEIESIDFEKMSPK